MTRFVKGETVTLTRDLDSDETGYVAAGAVTVEIDAGAAVAATRVGTEGAVYTVTVSAFTTLGAHSVVWLDGVNVVKTETVECVGGHLCTVADVRAIDKEFSDKVRFTADRIRLARDVVAAEFERITHRSFVTRSAGLSADSDGSGALSTGLLDLSACTAVSVNGVVGDPADLSVDEAGMVTGDALGVEGDALALTVEYGFATVPDEVVRAAALRIRSLIVQTDTGIPERATSIISPDGGQISLATPGRAGYETGVPEVDAVLARYRWGILSDVMGLA